MGPTDSENGHIDYTDGRIFEGVVVNGKANGEGRMLLPNGEVTIGRFCDDVCVEPREIRYHTGGRYVGGFKDGNYHGQGKLTTSKNETFEGVWESNDEFDGVAHYRNGNIITAHFVKLLPEGNGKSELPDGRVYEGPFVGGRANGRGKFTFKNGEVLEGVFANDFLVPTSFCTVRWPDGRIYDGQLGKDYLEGEGTMVWKNGCKLTGIVSPRINLTKKTPIPAISVGDINEFSFATGSKLECPDGTMFEGEYYSCYPVKGKITMKNCIFEGVISIEKDFFDGKLCWSNGDVYVGKIVQGQYEGAFNYEFGSDPKFAGCSINGIFNSSQIKKNTAKCYNSKGKEKLFFPKNPPIIAPPSELSWFSQL